MINQFSIINHQNIETLENVFKWL